MKYLITLLTITLTLNLQAAEKRPNIILIMADDQGYGDVGYTGHPFVQTPNLDAMAAKSIVFDRFYASAPVCSPTRASVLTGRTSMRTNVVNHGHYLRPQEVTIAEALKSAGYRTAHFGKWHIGSVQAASPTCPGKQGFDHWLTGLNFFDIDPYLSENGTYKQLKGQGTELTTDATIAYLKAHQNKPQKQPFFAVIWYPAPHVPHDEKSTKPQQYKGKKMAAYYQEISLIDEQVGKLKRALTEQKLDQNTLIWYCSDNGGLNPETSGGRAKKGSIYEGGLRIPSFIYYPSQWQKKTISAPTSTSDMYPTLLALTGTTVDDQPKLDGSNLLPLINGTQQNRSNPIGFWHSYTHGQVTFNDRIIKSLMLAQQAGKPSPHPERLKKNIEDKTPRRAYPNGSYPGHAALIDWPYKIHAIGNAKKGTRYELYDLSQDPMEKTDLSTKKPKRFNTMKAQIDQWQADVLNSLNGADY